MGAGIGGSALGAGIGGSALGAGAWYWELEDLTVHEEINTDMIKDRYDFTFIFKFVYVAALQVIGRLNHYFLTSLRRIIT